MFPLNPFAQFGDFYISVLLLAALAVHVAFSAGVFGDAQRLKMRGQAIVFVPGFLWSLATFLGGVPIAAIYWLIHHSTLRRD